MRLELKYTQKSNEYYCEITKKLDEICGYKCYKTYILDTRDLWSNCLAIRVLGRTVGNIEIDKTGKIIKITLSKDLIGEGKRYPSNIYGKLEKYIGEQLEL